MHLHISNVYTTAIYTKQCCKQRHAWRKVQGMTALLQNDITQN